LRSVIPTPLLDLEEVFHWILFSTTTTTTTTTTTPASNVVRAP
jgi:hypothetical protein